MRQIGTLSSEQEAHRFVDYLLTQGIVAQADDDADRWAIWVREEGQVEAAKEILEEFSRDSANEKYTSAKRSAQQLRAESQRERAAAARRNVSMRERWNQPMSRRAPLVMAMIGLSLFASLATGFGRDPRSALKDALMFGDTGPLLPGPERIESPDPLGPIKRGQVWRMVTPIFLHADWLHLLFNMSWLYFLGTQLETRRGTVRFGWMVLAMALVSNWAQFLIGQSPRFMGMSGVVYGIFGYIWIRQRMDPRSGYLLGDGTAILMMLFLVLGFAGALDTVSSGVANWAHAGGLLTGMGLAYVATMSGRAG